MSFMAQFKQDQKKICLTPFSSPIGHTRKGGTQAPNGYDQDQEIHCLVFAEDDTRQVNTSQMQV